MSNLPCAVAMSFTHDLNVSDAHVRKAFQVAKLLTTQSKSAHISNNTHIWSRYQEKTMIQTSLGYMDSEAVPTAADLQPVVDPGG